MKKILLLFTIAVLSFMSCDYVVAPNQVGTVTVPLSDTVRKIFIEDFTGHTCPNCPTAARMLDSLGNAYPTQIIGMGVHIDYYAEPCPPHQLPSGATPG
ncbi:MAG: thioredoxin family protein, partial [Bacteroidetes bacterium]|nr:thioredoxin family protein [Bacteroidota bacterium]